MAAHNQLGKEGEEAAAAHLAEKGYHIRHRDWRCGKKDIDIIAERRNELVVFIEVKTRKSEQFGPPEEAVTDRKIRRIIEAADVYIHRYSIDLPVRFDVITVVGEQPPFVIKHFEGAFYPPIW